MNKFFIIIFFFFFYFHKSLLAVDSGNYLAGESAFNNKDIKTSSGRPVVYVLTDENSENFKQFKARGFPSYMVKDGDKIFPIDVGDRSETSIIEASKKLQ